jgi:WD40 repeat protein
VMDVILASGGGEVSDGELKLWNVKEQKLVTDLPVGETEVMSLGFSPDGTRLFTAGWSQTVSIWDVITARHRGAARTSFGEIVNYLCVSPHDELMAVDGKQGLVFLLDSENLLKIENPTTATQHVLANHKKNITSLCFSGDGRYLATGSEDQFAVVWDPKTGEPVQSVDTKQGPVTAIGLSPDGQWLVTVNRATDAPLKIWDVATGRLLGEFEAGRVLAVAFSPTGELLATSDGAEVRLWSLQAASVLKSR